MPDKLVPATIGPELYQYENGAVSVFEGSCFNPDNPQHFTGSDAVRYGIAIQEARTTGDYATADEKIAAVRRFGFSVGTGKGVTVVSRPEMVKINGIVFDRKGLRHG